MGIFNYSGKLEGSRIYHKFKSIEDLSSRKRLFYGISRLKVYAISAVSWQSVSSFFKKNLVRLFGGTFFMLGSKEAFSATFSCSCFCLSLICAARFLLACNMDVL